jgi:hypothetical protein
LSSGSAEKYACTYGNKSKISCFEKMPALTAGYRIRELHFDVKSYIGATMMKSETAIII